MRIRRAAVLVMLSLGLMISSTAAVADVAGKAPSGFKTVKVKKAGFSIAVPKSWRVINVTSADADEILENLERAAPELADQLPADAAELAAQNIVLEAFAPEPHERFTANINVLRVAGVELPSSDEIEGTVRSIGGTDIQTEEVTVSGEDALTVEYDLESGDVAVHLLQITVEGPRGLIAVTITDGQNGLFLDDFDTMGSSLKLLAR